MNFTELFDRWKFALPIFLSCLIIVFGIFGHAAMIPYFVNSDTLQPAQMAWDMTRHDYAVTNFQWSRVPSFPDVAFFFLMEWARIGWRTAFLIYTSLVAVSAILSLGWVVSRMRGSTFREGAFWSGIAVTFALLSIMAVIVISPDQATDRIPQAILFICNSHGDAFLLSVVASVAALGALRGSRRQAWLAWIACVIGTASDTIFLGFFLLPFALAAILVVLRRRGANGEAPSPALPSLKATLRFIVASALACAIGWALKFPLPIQAMRLDIQGLDLTAVRAAQDLVHQPWVVALLIIALVLAIRAALVFWKPAASSPMPSVAVDRELLVLTGLGASAMSLGLAILLFVDVGIYRYAMPFFWWPLAIGMGLLPARPQRKLSAGIAAVATLATAVLPLSASALPKWHTPLEQCLSDHRREWNLKAGLATYWHSRITMVSSDWTLQVDQIDETGQAYLWGNNVAAYAHDMSAPQRAPEYNFIVADETTSAFDLETNFGPADRMETCADAEIWIYDKAITPPGVEYAPSGKLEIKFLGD